MSKLNIEFIAQLDPISKSAISFDSEGAGSIKFAFDSSQIAEVMKLAAFGRGKVFKVTCQGIDGYEKKGSREKAFAG